MRIYHISDIHFGHSCYSPLQLFTKRILGSLNYSIKRRFVHSPDLPWQFVENHSPKAGDIVLISGDFTTTAQKKEFQTAQDFIQRLNEKGSLVYAIPGNHDAYTKRAYKKSAFYNHFQGLLPFEGEFDMHLQHDQLAAFRLENRKWLVLIDCSTYTGYIHSTGLFSPNIEQKLQKLLDKIPSKESIYISCHYPFFQHESPRRRLVRGKHLQNLLALYPNIELYLHGHTHRHALADLRGNGLPLISDAGSLSVTKKSTYNTIDIDGDHIHVNVHRYQSEQWEIESTHVFNSMV